MSDTIVSLVAEQVTEVNYHLIFGSTQVCATYYPSSDYRPAYIAFFSTDGEVGGEIELTREFLSKTPAPFLVKAEIRNYMYEENNRDI